MCVCVCLCVFVTLSGACHLRTAWLDLAVSLEATADSLHLGRSNESLTLKASSGRNTKIAAGMEIKRVKQNKHRKNKARKTNTC